MTTARLADLKPWERNYNQGDVGAIYTSIATFGFNGTLRVWRDGIVVAGNHALKALQGMKQAGELPPEHIEVDADGEWLVPVTDVTHLDRMQAQAFAIADNRTRDLATTDDAALAALLQEVANTDAALLEATGYDGDDLDRMLLTLGGEWVSPEDAWQGMPEFEHEDKTAHRTIHIHLLAEEHVASLAAALGKPITDKTTYIWWPEQIIERYADKEYIDGE